MNIEFLKERQIHNFQLVFSFEEKEIRKYKWLTRKVLKNIDLSTFNLKYEIERTIVIGKDKGFRVRDNTIY